MKRRTNAYKEKVKLFGRELDSIITYTLDGVDYELSSEQLNSVNPHYESDILKSAMKCLEFDSNVEIPKKTVINFTFGVKTRNDNVQNYRDNYDYIDYGNYIVDSVEKQEDTKSYRIICYDKMINSMIDYKQILEYRETLDEEFQEGKNYFEYNNDYTLYTGDRTGNPSLLGLYEYAPILYPVTIRDYITKLCTFLDLEFANKEDTFVNYDKLINNELYLDSEGNSLNYTFRDVLDELAQVTASTICINDDDELEIRYINDTEDTIDEEYLKNVNVNFGEKYGPVNSIVLSRSAESDNIFKRDEESILQNGLCEIKISENQILNFNNRDEFLIGIYNQLNGLEYYINDFSSTGVTYYEMCDKYNVLVDEKTYSCIMFNDDTNITQGLEENIYTDMPEKTETDYEKASKTDRTINRTTRIADKQNGIIEDLVSRISIIETTTGETYTKEDINRLIQTAKDGLINEHIMSGGNNIFRNTGLWYENDGNDRNENPYEFWIGLVIREQEPKAQNLNCLKLQNGTLSQEQIVPNGRYTISFKYKKLIQGSTVRCLINDIEYEPITSMEETEYEQTIETSLQKINVKFISDVDNACKIYDLMVNSGESKTPYTQNQNESTTDTVKISKGITITSSDLATTFKANADGIRTLDENGNELAVFTDKGMETKQQIVRDEAQIVDVLFTRVNNHVWITKI